MKENKLDRMKQTPSPDQSLGGTVPEQSGGGVFQPKHAVLHHTENPVPAGPLFGERRSEGCLLQRENEYTDDQSFLSFLLLFFFIKVDIHRKKKKGKKTKTKKEKGQRAND